MSDLATEVLGEHRLPSCTKCGSLGTIVSMGLCCKVRYWNSLGGVWDIGDWRKDNRRTCKRPGRRND